MTQRRCARRVLRECPDPGTCALLRARREFLRIASVRRLDVDTQARLWAVREGLSLRVQVVSLVIIILKLSFTLVVGLDSPSCEEAQLALRG